MRDVTIYRWSRGVARPTDPGRTREWLFRETFFCTQRCLQAESRAAFGKATVVRTTPDGTVVLTHRDAEGPMPNMARGMMTFEPVTFAVEDDVAEVLDEVFEDTRVLIWGPSDDGARIRLQLNEFMLVVTVHDDDTTDVSIKRRDAEDGKEDA